MSGPRSGEDRVYFPALDGLRFVAFGLVFLFHRGIPQVATAINAVSRRAGYRPVTGAKAPWSLGDSVLDNGWIGVQLFFILSGFLITTLLLREESRFGKIDLRAFWMRRILRIWPLYYFTVGLTFFVLPWMDGAWATASTRELWARHLVPFLVFGGNWSMAILGPVPYDAISVLWSVCVEEQFYILCPLLIAFVPAADRVRVVAGLMLLGVAGRVLTAMALERRVVTPVFFQWSTITQLDTLLSGVLLALVRERSGPRWNGARRFAPNLAVVLLGLALLAKPGLGHGSVASRALDFIAIWVVGVAAVAIAATNRGFIATALSHPRIVRLGRISYGLYMYHEIAFFLQRKLFEFAGWFPYQDFAAPLVSMGLTVWLASASYAYLERPFLRRKMRWSRVESRPI